LRGCDLTEVAARGALIPAQPARIPHGSLNLADKRLAPEA